MRIGKNRTKKGGGVERRNWGRKSENWRKKGEVIVRENRNYWKARRGRVHEETYLYTRATSDHNTQNLYYCCWEVTNWRILIE